MFCITITNFQNQITTVHRSSCTYAGNFKEKTAPVLTERRLMIGSSHQRMPGPPCHNYSLAMATVRVTSMTYSGRARHGSGSEKLKKGAVCCFKTLGMKECFGFLLIQALFLLLGPAGPKKTMSLKPYERGRRRPRIGKMNSISRVRSWNRKGNARYRPPCRIWPRSAGCIALSPSGVNKVRWAPVPRARP